MANDQDEFSVGQRIFLNKDCPSILTPKHNLKKGLVGTVVSTTHRGQSLIKCEFLMKREFDDGYFSFGSLVKKSSIEVVCFIHKVYTTEKMGVDEQYCTGCPHQLVCISRKP